MYYNKFQLFLTQNIFSFNLLYKPTVNTPQTLFVHSLIHSFSSCAAFSVKLAEGPTRTIQSDEGGRTSRCFHFRRVDVVAFTVGSFRWK